jgi:hypothetical protein
MVVSPPELSFGLARTGERVVRTFEIANEGRADLEVTSVLVSASGFTLVEPATPSTLSPGGVWNVEVLFEAGLGLGEGVATVSGSDLANPQVDVRLFGELGVPRLALEPEALDFGELPLLCEEVSTVVLRSVGTVPVTVDALLVTGEGFSLFSSPELPLVLEPGASHAVEVSFFAELRGMANGYLVAGSDDPSGQVVADLSGLALDDGSCGPHGDVELTFEVRYERADVAVILDTSSSMGPTTTVLAGQFASIAAALGSTIPDLTWGVATFDDYQLVPGFPMDRPFRLAQQQTDDLALAGAALGSIDLAVGGMDWEEAGAEALMQAATGAGYDQNCNGAFDAAKEVLPFVASPLDPFHGTVAGSEDPAVPGTGTEGGMGFRARVVPIFLMATDAKMKEPGPQTPGGCPSDAGPMDAAAAINALGGKFVGVEVVGGWGAGPRPDLDAIAMATGSSGDLDGDGLTEPTVTRWSGSAAEFRDSVVRAIQALAAAATFDKVVLEVVHDPDGMVLAISPSQYTDVVAGTDLTFDLTLDGEMLLVPTAAASEVRLELVADDTLTLAERTIWVD